jgi:preprotein translocase subunit SecB
MADRSSLASLQFISYKIDSINLKMVNDVEVLASNSLSRPYEINFNMGIRNPAKYLIKDIIHYVGGLEINLNILGNQKMQILQGTFGIAGLFRLKNIEQQEENNMVQINIPAILLPYLRSAITTILSQAGFGTIVLPLINIHEVAKQHPVEIFDFTKNSPPIVPPLATGGHS